jgi:thiosulfate reductase cytochrome b subunit
LIDSDNSDASNSGSNSGAATANGTIIVHPGVVRMTHWINVVAMLTMISSGWRIYNASPLFDFRFPRDIAIGGWLAGGLQWHFAAMWLLVLNGLAYLAYGLIAGHYRRHFLPVSPASIVREIGNTLRGRLSHELGVYNPLQRTAYLGVIALGVLIVLSGLAIWKPVQLQLLAVLMGGYEGARLVHFFSMAGFVLFVLIHVVMVLLVPRTFLPMLTGRAKKARSEAP